MKYRGEKVGVRSSWRIFTRRGVALIFHEIIFLADNNYVFRATRWQVQFLNSDERRNAFKEIIEWNFDICVIHVR